MQNSPINQENIVQDPLDQNESVYSKNYVESAKFKEFVSYLCKKDVTLAIVKFLISMRSAGENPANPQEALKDYFGAYNEHKWSEVV